LHEVSGVKVPRPASPFITHETPMLLEGMAVAVSRGKCMDEFIDISTEYDGEWYGCHDRLKLPAIDNRWGNW